VTLNSFTVINPGIFGIDGMSVLGELSRTVNVPLADATAYKIRLSLEVMPGDSGSIGWSAGLGFVRYGLRNG